MAFPVTKFKSSTKQCELELKKNYEGSQFIISSPTRNRNRKINRSLQFILWNRYAEGRGKLLRHGRTQKSPTILQIPNSYQDSNYYMISNYTGVAAITNYPKSFAISVKMAVNCQEYKALLPNTKKENITYFSSSARPSVAFQYLLVLLSPLKVPSSVRLKRTK